MASTFIRTRLGSTITTIGRQKKTMLMMQASAAAIRSVGSDSRVVCITSGKGGVGKTTTAASIGMGLAMRGKKTCVIDFDLALRNLDIHLVSKAGNVVFVEQAVQTIYAHLSSSTQHTGS